MRSIGAFRTPENTESEAKKGSRTLWLLANLLPEKDQFLSSYYVDLAPASDDHAGLKAARRAMFAGVTWQRCQFHLQHNAQGYVSKLDQRQTVARQIRNIFNAPDINEANRQLQAATKDWSQAHPKLAAWAQDNLAEGFAVFGLPPEHRVRMRTTNGLERLNKKIKRRTRVATLFPNSASCLRLVSAILAEQDEEWMSSKIYLTVKP